MPAAVVQRLVKDSFITDKDNMIVNKDAKKAFQSTAGLFILYIFSIANDISRENKRNKVMPQDVYDALKEVGFEKYANELG